MTISSSPSSPVPNSPTTHHQLDSATTTTTSPSTPLSPYNDTRAPSMQEEQQPQQQQRGHDHGEEIINRTNVGDSRDTTFSSAAAAAASTTTTLSSSSRSKRIPFDGELVQSVGSLSQLIDNMEGSSSSPARPRLCDEDNTKNNDDDEKFVKQFQEQISRRIKTKRGNIDDAVDDHGQVTATTATTTKTTSADSSLVASREMPLLKILLSSHNDDGDNVHDDKKDVMKSSPGSHDDQQQQDEDEDEEEEYTEVEVEEEIEVEEEEEDVEGDYDDDQRRITTNSAGFTLLSSNTENDDDILDDSGTQHQHNQHHQQSLHDRFLRRSIFFEEGVDDQRVANPIMHYLHVGCWYTKACDYYQHRRPHEGEVKGQAVMWLHNARPRDRFVFLVSNVRSGWPEGTFADELKQAVYGYAPRFALDGRKQSPDQKVLLSGRPLGVEVIEILHSDITAVDFSSGLVSSRFALECSEVTCIWFPSEYAAREAYCCPISRPLDPKDDQIRKTLGLQSSETLLEIRAEHDKQERLRFLHSSETKRNRNSASSSATTTTTTSSSATKNKSKNKNETIITPSKKVEEKDVSSPSTRAELITERNVSSMRNSSSAISPSRGDVDDDETGSVVTTSSAATTSTSCQNHHHDHPHHHHHHHSRSYSSSTTTNSINNKNSSSYYHVGAITPPLNAKYPTTAEEAAARATSRDKKYFTTSNLLTSDGGIHHQNNHRSANSSSQTTSRTNSFAAARRRRSSTPPPKRNKNSSPPFSSSPTTTTTTTNMMNSNTNKNNKNMSRGVSPAAASTSSSSSPLTSSSSSSFTHQNHQQSHYLMADTESRSIHNTMIVGFTQDPNFQAVIRELVLPGGSPTNEGLGSHVFTQSVAERQRLLSMSEAGIPSWALFCTRRGIFYHQYLRVVMRAAINIWPLIALGLGLYDLYCHMPYVHKYLVPFFDLFEDSWIFRLSLGVAYVFSYFLYFFQWVAGTFHFGGVFFSTLLMPLAPAVELIFVGVSTFIFNFFSMTFGSLGTVIFEFLKRLFYPVTLVLSAAPTTTTATASSVFNLPQYFKRLIVLWKTVLRPVKNLIKAIYDGVVHVGSVIARHEASLRMWYMRKFRRLQRFVVSHGQEYWRTYFQLFMVVIVILYLPSLVGMIFGVEEFSSSASSSSAKSNISDKY